MRYIRVEGVFEVDDKTDPQAFLEQLGAWSEEKDWSAQLRLREVDEAAWEEMEKKARK